MAKRKGTLRLRVDGWNDSESDSDEAATQSENDAAAKKRIDYLLHTLLKIPRDKVFEQLTEVREREIYQRLINATKKHKEWSH